MSRTGVGVRVVIDGNQLDDGCFDWNAHHYGDPWTEYRRNYAVGSGAYWVKSTGTVVASNPTPDVLRLECTVEGNTAWWDAWTVRATAVSSGSVFIPLAEGDVLNASVTYRAKRARRVRYRYSFRDSAGVAIGATAFAVDPNQSADDAWGTFAIALPAAPALTAAISIEINSANSTPAIDPQGFVVGDYMEFRGMWLAVNDPDAPFDGNSVSRDPATRYRWTASENTSPSVAEYGTPISDTPAGVLPEGLSADEGLQITWGRATTVEQPSPSTCVFSVTDDPGTLYYDAFSIGSDVQIYADAKISGGAVVPAFTDPDFESEVRAVTKNAVVGRDSRHVTTGTLAAVIKPVNANTTYSAQFPPGTLQTPGANPNAWDNLPHLSPGQTWHLAVTLWVPEGLTVVVSPLVYTGPYAASATTLPQIGAAFGAGDWHTVEADVSPGVQLGWLGVQIDAAGGQSWADTPEDWEWGTTDENLEWRDLSDVYIDNVAILAPEGGTDLTILVFDGRITDMSSQWDGASPRLDVTATDFLGDLGNRFVGDEPWLLEPLATRVGRILELAQSNSEGGITADIATTVADVPVSWEDVDHRSASGLLADLANSVDAVLWSATHIVSGPFVKIEDPAQRPALYQLALIDGYIEIVVIDVSTLPPEQRPLDLSSCDVLRDPVDFVVDVADIGTRATVGWKEQTLNDQGQPAPTDRTLALIDAGREVAYGTRNISTQTLLTTSAAATSVAERLLSRQTGQWRMTGLRIADEDFRVPDAEAVVILTSLLDGVRRGGLPVRVVDLPSWSPLGETAPAYLEGGTYTYTGGGWQLDLTVSRGTGLGQNAQWDQLTPDWTWDQWNPSIRWEQLRGVAAPH